MRSRFRVSLGGVHMDTLADELMILDVAYPQLQPVIEQSRNAELDGYDAGDEYLQKNTVTVTFIMRIYDPAKRNAAVQKVNAWAQAGGTLKVSDRTGQQLMDVRCERYAAVTSALKWTDKLTLVFATTGIPFWQSETEKKLTLSGTGPKGTLKMDGNTRSALVTVEATAQSPVTAFQVTIGSDKIQLKNISIGTGKILRIDYIKRRYLRIRIDGKSAIDKMTADSADLLRAACGADTAVSFTADAKMTVSMTARGMWI